MLKIKNTEILNLTIQGNPLPIGAEIIQFIDGYNSVPGKTGMNFLNKIWQTKQKPIYEFNEGTNEEEIVGYEEFKVLISAYQIDQFPKNPVYIDDNSDLDREGKQGVGTREDCVYQLNLLAKKQLNIYAGIPKDQIIISGINTKPF